MNRFESRLAQRASKADRLSGREPERRSGQSRIQRVRHEIRQRYPLVEAVTRVSPGFVSVTLRGDDLKDFPSLSFDDHIKVFIPGADGQEERRDYTPRQFDATSGTLVLEFALHDGGVACDWANNLKVGERVHLGGPKGSMVIPLDYDWHWLVGDPTSLPAIHRRVEELPTGANATVIVQCEHVHDQRVLESAAELEVVWVAGYNELLQAVTERPLPAGDGFVWAAGEGKAMAALRALVVNDKQQPSDSTRISAYWKAGVQGFSEKG
jgi:NADPH-dependent ferric siderophore reductase|tara:strand:- start:8912 stop:9712 length:801 start_codon:yes stop_codon:yes gene_type:complete